MTNRILTGAIAFALSIVSVMTSGTALSPLPANAVEDSSAVEHEHIYTSTITKNATCTETGVKTYICECGNRYTEEILATGHNYIEIIVEPSYLEGGYTLFKCPVCGESYEDEYTDKIKLKVPTGFKVEEVSASSIRVAWNKMSDADGYIVCKYDEAQKKIVRVGKTTKNVFSVKKLSSATDYTLYVKSYKMIGSKAVYSNYSKIISATNPTKVNYELKSSEPGKININWKKSPRAEGYIIYYRSKGLTKWTRMAKVGLTTTSYEKYGLPYGKTYEVYVEAYRISNKKIYRSLHDVKSQLVSYYHKLYYVKCNSNVYTKSQKYKATIYGGSWYTGHTDYRYPGYVILDYMSTEVLVNARNVSVRSNAEVLPTGAIGQYGGSIAGYAACGPAAVAILVNSEKGISWSKDELIRYSERHCLNDQGSLRGGGGMTAPRLLELIKDYSGGQYTAKNKYSYYSSYPVGGIKNEIDAGHRCLVVVQYTSSIVTYRGSSTHFVVVCGYEYINGLLYFYYADPYYGNGGASLKRVSAYTLNTSMSIVNIEPRTLIVLN